MIDNHFEMERYFFYYSAIQATQIVYSFVAIHEEVGHGVLIVGLDSLGHLFSKSWEPHGDHEIVFYL